ncbi:MAG: hypothetical protein PHO06_03820, partial [Clostridia bacterium]|nr:hypothetical protein [Clostridia bacterium]
TITLFVVGVFAAASMQVNVSVSVNYSPAVIVEIKMATNDVDSNFYYSGKEEDPFPAGAIILSNLEQVNIPDASCNYFNEFIVYLQVKNLSAFGVLSSFNVEFGATGASESDLFDVVESSTVNVNLARGDGTPKTGIAKLVLKAKANGSEAIKITFNLDAQES